MKKQEPVKLFITLAGIIMIGLERSYEIEAEVKGKKMKKHNYSKEALKYLNDLLDAFTPRKKLK